MQQGGGSTSYAISLHDVRDAAGAVHDVVVRTPLLENPDVNAHLGGRLLIKAESAQRTGAFKVRGAYYRIRRMDAAERARGGSQRPREAGVAGVVVGQQRRGDADGLGDERSERSGSRHGP